MTSPIINDLKWTAQLKVLPTDRIPKLIGDKITLPQTALEQLLNAATVTVISDAPTPANFDPFNPYSFAAATSSRVLERQQNLPHPLTFRLVNPENGNTVYAGVREFSAEDETIGLSAFLYNALACSDESKVTVHAQKLPKGSHVRFRPLEAGYDPEDWKSLLERQLRNTFTTLTKGEIVRISAGKDEYQFLIDEIKPDGDGICIVDTDLEVDIEALNEEQARETLKKRLEKSSVKSSSRSTGGTVKVNQAVFGEVAQDDYVDYNLDKWDSLDDLVVEVEAEAGSVDVYVSFFSHLQRERPRQDLHQLLSACDSPTQTLRLRDAGESYQTAESVYIALHGVSSSSYSLTVHPAVTETEPETNHQGEKRCGNCLQWVPERTMMLHENFCLRNNVLCPDCQQVFKTQSEEWQNHWHCGDHDAHGNSQSTRHHHEFVFHEPAICKSCGYAARSMADLAVHKTSKCPEKMILCQFCHLLVPQQGPDDLDVNDPEVVLSGLTPHELSDGATTTECHVCSKIVRLRDMSTHLRHHDMDRLIRPRPQVCRNVLCGNTLGSEAGTSNELGLCGTCFGPLYNSAFDPEHRALKRRVERRYLTQMLTGCEKSWCLNEQFCKTAAVKAGLQPLDYKTTISKIKPALDELMLETPLYFCTDEFCQNRRRLAEMLASEREDGYDLSWCIAAMEASKGELDAARDWLKDRAPKKSEER